MTGGGKALFDEWLERWADVWCGAVLAAVFVVGPFAAWLYQ